MCLSVFKIFDIVANGEFVERINLRVGRSLNLNFSAADVTWNPIDGGYKTLFSLLQTFTKQLLQSNRIIS